MTANQNFEAYQSELGEKAVKIVLREIAGLELEKITEKQNQRNPDYEVRDTSGELLAICEVKSLVDTLTKSSAGMELSQEELQEISRKRDRNHRSKLMRQHGKALTQVLDYPDLVTLIFFASFDMTDHIDMGIVLQDYKEQYPEGTMADAYILMKVHQATSPSNEFDITETIQIMHNTQKGLDFTSKYLATMATLQKVGKLPLKFQTSSSVRSK